jgi:hypothetical protein
MVGSLIGTVARGGSINERRPRLHRRRSSALQEGVRAIIEQQQGGKSAGQRPLAVKRWNRRETLARTLLFSIWLCPS